VKYKTKVLYEGRPGESIIKIADDEQVKMVIMGTRGLGSIRRTILGTFTRMPRNILRVGRYLSFCGIMPLPLILWDHASPSHSVGSRLSLSFCGITPLPLILWDHTSPFHSVGSRHSLSFCGITPLPLILWDHASSHRLMCYVM
jgi:hypothetical protein